ncbi:MAG: hypothetical protein RXR31_08660 [Thermoproteota archaeon]
MTSRKYEVKIIKEVKYLPHVFKVRNREGKIIKIVTTNKDFINCEKEVGKFFQCFELKDNKLKKTDDLYYVPQTPIFSIKSEKKLIKDEKYAENIIISTLTNYELLDKNLLITYNDNEISAYSKFHKAQLYQFYPLCGNETIEIFEAIPPHPKEQLWFERLDKFKVNDHEIKFSNYLNNNVDIAELYSLQGLAYLIYTIVETTVTINFPDGTYSSRILYPDQYYLMIYLNPKEK